MKTRKYPYLFIAAIAACLHFFGCASDFRGTCIPKEHQAEAIQVAWNDTLGMETPFTYEILFIEERDQGCAGWYEEWHGVCVVGLTEDLAGVMQLLWLPDMKWSDTAFAHEMAHAYGNAHGNSDPNHVSPLFCDPGQSKPCDTWPMGGTAGVISNALTGAGL